MMAILAGVGPGDEVVMPSFTFVSTANAFVLRGAVPVFVDIDPASLNLDVREVEKAIGPKTKAICAVHYAGVACEMDELTSIARENNLLLFEDAAQGAMASYRGKPLGTLGALGALSFHETKNIISGEGGALIVNDPKLAKRAEIIREKGTNRSSFFRGEVDKYTWVDIGSSYLPSEIIAAFLWAQFEHAQSITEERRRIWQLYYQALEPLESRGLLARPKILPDREHNAHIFYVLTHTLDERSRVIAKLNELDVNAVFHYVPLHSAPAGRKYGRPVGDMAITNRVSDTLLRLPLHIGMNADSVSRVVDALTVALT
jgi:dTDP-4-amino-4,6-dideoxygalactose transaminase